MLDWFWWHFPTSGVETYVFVPPLVMLAISSLTSMGGVSGAFVLLPFQISVLGYASPGASATNFVYNIVAIPLGCYRHIREGRMSWPIYGIVIAGSLPGVLVGYYVRVVYLPDPRNFKIFVALVLLYLGVRLTADAYSDVRSRATAPVAEHAAPASLGGTIGLKRTRITLWGQQYSFATMPIFFLSLAVGVIGGAYGIGGGAIMSPIFLSVLRLPVYAVSGAVLLATWCTSVFGAFLYAAIPTHTTVNVSPDWVLGLLFGLGGMVGIYLGTRLQKWVPAWIIKLVLGVAVLFISARYLLGW